MKKSPPPEQEGTQTYILRGPIPEQVQQALKARLEKRISEEWDHTLVKLKLRFRSYYAYVDVQDPTEEVPTHLCRLGYLGNMEEWQFAFYKYSDEKYEISMDMEGNWLVCPETALDISAGVYLQGG
ncbi:hypothetical protein HZB60_09335 [candidate division KSB1 bacterium]|nr:hypothetical protein [candidate division KSB1 bacterium]